MEREAAKAISQTNADAAFNMLRDEINRLELLPGTKISEAATAERLGVSRQPVRSAFNRLGNMELLLIRPQRATVVRGFSMDDIKSVRFVRRAVELDVITRACQLWDQSSSQALEDNLHQQYLAIEEGNIPLFHECDYGFHKLICELSGHPYAFEMIERSKQKVDRLCLLSLKKDEDLQTIWNDHKEIAMALKHRSEKDAQSKVEKHLGRLDHVISNIYAQHAEYFE